MKFKANNITWNIKEVSPNDSMLLADGNRCRGTTHYAHQLIYLDKDLSLESKKQVLRHELTHAFLYSTQIYCKDDFTEEMLCDFIGLYGERIEKVAKAYFKG